MQRTAILGILGLLVYGQSPESAASGGPGPPPRAEGSYRFDCNTIRGSIAWRQQRFEPDRVPALIDALRVTPLELSVSERAVPVADLARLRALFRDVAWIEQVWATCDGDQALISLNVMPLRDWIAYIEENVEQRPRTRLWVIRVSANGIVSIS